MWLGWRIALSWGWGMQSSLVRSRQRYERAMDLLPSAVEHADKAIVFDNSGASPVRVVAKDGERLQVAPNAPEWAKGSFLSAIEQRMASREQLQGAARAAGADRFTDAVAETGRTYSGGWSM